MLGIVVTLSINGDVVMGCVGFDISANLMTKKRYARNNNDEDMMVDINKLLNVFLCHINILSKIIGTKSIAVSFEKRLNKSKIFIRAILVMLIFLLDDISRAIRPKNRNRTSCKSEIYATASWLMGCTRKISDKKKDKGIFKNFLNSRNIRIEFKICKNNWKKWNANGNGPNRENRIEYTVNARGL